MPDHILTIPILAAFAVSVAHFSALYRIRVQASAGEMLGAVFAAMAVQWTVARAVAIGLVKERVPFLRTAKGGLSRKGPDFPAFWEAVIGSLLLAGAFTLIATNYKQVHEINIFAWVLAVQSLPFVAAVGLAAIEGTPVNSFAFWRGIEARIGAKIAAKIATRAAVLLPQSQQVIAQMAEPPKLARRHRRNRAVAITRRAQSPQAAPNTTSPAGSPRH